LASRYQGILWAKFNSSVVEFNPGINYSPSRLGEMMSGSTLQPLRALDLFCGVGGSSYGASMAGIKVVGAVDMWSLAHNTYLDNFPDTRFYPQKAEDISPKKIEKELGPIQLILASPECTSHTCARGNREQSEASNLTAFEVNRFARVLRPRWIVVENVIQMRLWKRYQEWLAELEQLGYRCRDQLLNAADFGVPQSRKRLFIMCDLEGMPPEVLPSPGRKIRPARAIISYNGTFSFSRLDSKRRAKPTLERAKRAMANLGNHAPFLIVYYGSDGAGGWQRLNVPLRTVTTLDRFAYVRRRKNGHEMRMLQVPELKKAMGFPARYRLNHGVRRDKIRLLGNAVCPPVIKAIIQAITSSSG
jgi:DNA (cytosine-5)-methyltransferase 1